DPASIRVRVDVPLDRVPLVGRAGSIEIRSDTAPNRSFPGKVLRVVQVADVQKNTVQFHVGLDGAHPELRPETLCQARFVGGAGGAGAAAGGSSAVRVMVATRLVRDPDGSPWVWAVDPLTRCAQRRSLRLGGESGDRTIVEEGLRPGDRVLSDPPADLREGERLKITE
ncbi:MAG: hypothetical protein HYY93_01005, partial [Planctomycetes bacterium]|nr:hypothetical protein [Planctomycetota bacterium]